MGGEALVIKIGVHGEPSFTLSLILHDYSNPIDPQESSSEYRTYRLTPEWYWFVFHRDHRLRNQSACERIDFFLAAGRAGELHKHKEYCNKHPFDNIQGGIPLFDGKTHLVAQKTSVRQE